MTIINIPQPGSCELGDSDVETLNNYSDSGFAVYSYWDGCYEGAGHMICYIKGWWFYRDLSHCSCYGPVDDFRIPSSAKNNFKDVIANFSDELKGQTKHLVEFLENNKQLFKA